MTEYATMAGRDLHAFDEPRDEGRLEPPGLPVQRCPHCGCSFIAGANQDPVVSQTRGVTDHEDDVVVDATSYGYSHTTSESQSFGTGWSRTTSTTRGINHHETER
jgi:hypothetical protein